MNQQELFKAWTAEAKVLGFELEKQQIKSVQQTTLHNIPTVKPVTDSPSPAANIKQTAARIGHNLGKAMQVLKQPSAMPGTRLKLTKKSRRKDANKEAER